MYNNADTDDDMMITTMMIMTKCFCVIQLFRRYSGVAYGYMHALEFLSECYVTVG